MIMQECEGARRPSLIQRFMAWVRGGNEERLAPYEPYAAKALNHAIEQRLRSRDF